MEQQKPTILKKAINTEWASTALFSVFALLLLGGYNYEYLYKVQNCNLFLANSVFFNETMQHSSGLLRYISRYLAQYLYYPWLGALFMSLGLVGIKKLTDRLVGGNSQLTVLNYLPALLCLLAQTSVGYTLFCNFESAYVVELELGLAISLLLANGIKQKSGYGWIALSALLCTILYFAIGLFAHLALLAASATWFHSNRRASVAGAGTALVLQALLSHLTGSYLLNEAYSYAFFSPLPDSAYGNLFTISLLALASIVLLPLAGPYTNVDIRHRAYNTILLAAGLVGVFLLSNRDTNFRTELRLQHLTEEHKWEEVIEAANALETPTNISDSYRFLALHQTNRLWDEAFKHSGRLDTIKSPYQDITDLAFTPDLYFYCSLVNKAYRWEMEKWVTTGRNVELLKQFAVYALVRDEQPLARRYTTLLKQTSIYDSWAAKMEKYIGNRDQLFADFPSYKRVYDGQIKENVYTENCNLQTSYAKYRHPDKEQMRLRLMLDLYYLNLKQFMADFRYACDDYSQQMPVYMQEALTIYAMQNKQPQLVKMFPVSRPVIELCNNFFHELRLYQGMPEEGAKQLLKYKGTLCYHFAFCNIYDYKDKRK